MQRRVTRRQLLRVGAVGTAGSFAGCPQEDVSESGDDAEERTEDDGSEEEKETESDREPTEKTEPDPKAETEDLAPPDLTIQGIVVEPDPVRQAHETTVTVTVANVGDREGEWEVAIEIDSDEAAVSTVSLPPDETQTIEHTYRPGRTGTREIRVGNTTESFDVHQYPATFITRDGTEFVRDGEPHYIHGTNNDHVFRAPEWYLDRVYASAAELGLSAVRTVSIGVGPDGTDCDFAECAGDRFSFMPEPGRFGETAFRGMDYAIYKAKQYGIRLVIPLVDNWEAYGMAQYVEWSDTAEVHDDFYTDEESRQLYKAFVEGFLTRTNTYTGVEYRNEPTILMWELANEPQAQGWVEADQEGGDPAPEKLQGWIEEMSTFVKSIDPNHLLGTGGHGFYEDKLYQRDKGEDFIANNQVEHIDCCSVHMYPKHWYEGERDRQANSIERGSESIRIHAKDAHEVVEKPVYFGEFRPHTHVDRAAPDAEEAEAERAAILDAWYDTMAEHDVNAALHWAFFDPYDADNATVHPDRDQPLEGQYNSTHNVYPWDGPTTDVMREYSTAVDENG